MLTRRPRVAAAVEKPSVAWHLMSGTYCSIFLPDRCEQVEYWYNKVATRVQREVFRRLCHEIHNQDPDRGVPRGVAMYTVQYKTCEAKTIIKYHGSVLSELGRKKAYAWLLHDSNRRDREYFTEIFTGLEVSFTPQSVMKKDYKAPDVDSYGDIDRTHFLSSIDWFNPESKRNRTREQVMKYGSGLNSLRVEKISAKKPKGQLDGFSPLVVLGMGGGAGENEKVRESLKSEQPERYFTVDGCTVFVAGGRARKQSTEGGGRDRVITTFYDT
ncbi:hypothetical protein ERJ75_000329500 [Trypanosoma vivax]|uniref:Uncharacterized protein n=1 Tax=Trypanosoma vivax (strain Y486) TaxID=1055687 RepID=G0UAG7_TRYVY|nr:hypothetical protein TRVL_07918 [Trypanosoma vivax]KAH8617975.1 hypothetical protein ERJ75_000328700 [Trypanosoma vivax]KAH8617987.1 hypothetical protein ERJ75_000329500 [Trypanosoma vivax]CCC52800.1 conserved hypothetical protein [Trypanosoma vivax Y486]